MKTARIIIVGGGLSGLYAAYLLEQNGIDYLLLEARAVLGGRILSASPSAQGAASAAQAMDSFDLGPTWFWPSVQPQLDRLVSDLGLQRFPQFETDDMLVERSPNAPPNRMRGHRNSPVSMRVVGGMGMLIDALYRRLDATRIITCQSVRRLRSTDAHVELESCDATGRVTTWGAEQVLLAMPPRLVENCIEFTPPLPHTLARQWHATPTWMAPHAKYIAVYDTPFWREQGLSSEMRSTWGPLSEIHDASVPGGSAALFGFFGMPTHMRKQMPEHVLQSHCREQLARLLGPQAATPRLEFIKDWANDPHTTTAADLDDSNQHAEAPAISAASGPWHSRLIGIASEWAPQFPGYLAGAIEAATLGVQALPEFASRKDDLAASHISLRN